MSSITLALKIAQYVEAAISELDARVKQEDLRGSEIQLAQIDAFLAIIKYFFLEDLNLMLYKKTFSYFDEASLYIKGFLEKGQWNGIRINIESMRKFLPEIKNGLQKLKATNQSLPLSNNVFIVHGREHKPVEELKTLLLGFGLNPIVLHEKAGGSRTIVEKLEKYSDVGYAFVILTPDDVGCLNVSITKNLLSIAKKLKNLVEGYTVIKKKGTLKRARDELSKILNFLKPRARQNVVLEFGYFIGLLGRDRVCCLYTGNVELPSDMQGIAYVHFKSSVRELKEMIINELREAGYEIEM